MIVDSSALIAILLDEPGADTLLLCLASSRARISAATYLETGMVLKGYPPTGRAHLLDRLLEENRVGVEPFTEQQAKIAVMAFQQFGKGIHPARLNFGDCIAYALSVQTGEPLLYKGDDFARTDIVSAVVHF